MRSFLLVLVAAIACFGQAYLNWRGDMDTTRIYEFRSDSVDFSRAFNNTNGENKFVYVLADDTSQAGFASDSINFTWGYQVGYPKYLSGSWDTAWCPSVIVDTFTLSRIYNPYTLEGSYWSTGADGVITAVQGQVDTSSFSGWAQQSSGITPPWYPYIRMWAKGETGNITGSYVNLMFGIQQRKYLATGDAK